MTKTSLNSQRIYVAGHGGMVGSAVVRALEAQGTTQIISAPRSELDLTDQLSVNHFYREHRPDSVIFCAGKVGGIHANNTYPAEFIYENLTMAAHAIHAAYQNKVSRFLFLGSTCIYPRMAPQPMPEDCLLTGPLEQTNEAYALAKISALKMCQYYRAQYGVTFHAAMPTNLYGPGDNYHPENSHVLPALISRFHEAKQNGDPQVAIWGTGTPRREFLHVDDLAIALLHLLQISDPPDLVNVGTGSDVTIRELAEMIAEAVGYEGQIVQDPTKPDGTPVKRTDCSLIHSTGWQATTPLAEGVKQTYRDFLQNSQTDTLRVART
ncbi:MAG: GDP-L-fucose synthase [Mariniblastus sp.]|nr:GDP-L-fucose synthase [Mariniblastus sp.]